MRKTTQFLRSLLLCIVAVVTLGACVYRIDVQQGNLLEQNDIEAIRDGMTRSQVRFLLGTPLVESPFHADRWDYMYFFRKGRSRESLQQWLIVYFDDDRVREILKDVPVDPSV